MILRGLKILLLIVFVELSTGKRVVQRLKTSMKQVPQQV